MIKNLKRRIYWQYKRAVFGQSNGVKLPKSWLHWLQKYGFKNFRVPKHRSHHGFYFNGRGHHWRVNCYGMLQCGDTYATFDRWALCDIVELPLPKTEAEFVEAIKNLLIEKGV